MCFCRHFVQCADKVPAPLVRVRQVKFAYLLVVGGDTASQLLTVPAAVHIIVPVVIVHQAGLPQRVKLFTMAADLHFHTGNAVRVFAVGQVTNAAVAMAGQRFGCAVRPRHGAYQHRGRGVDGACQVQVYGRILGIVHGHGLNAQNLGNIEHIVVVCLVSVVVRIASAFTQAHAAARQQVGALGFGQQHTLHAGFGCRKGVLVVVVGAAFQLAAVAQRPVAQPPGHQGKLGVAIAPQPIVGGQLPGQRQRRVGAGPRHWQQARAAGHAARAVFTAVKGRVPGQQAVGAVRGYIARHRHIAVACAHVPAGVKVAAVIPFLHGQGRGEAVHRRGLAGHIKGGFGLNSQHLHGAVFQALGVGTHIPGHGVVFGPICHARADIRHQGCSAAAVCQIIQRGATGIAAHALVDVPHRVGLFAPGGVQHGGKAFQAAVLVFALFYGKRPPQFKDLLRVGAVQHGRVHAVQRRRWGRFLGFFGALGGCLFTFFCGAGAIGCSRGTACSLGGALSGLGGAACRLARTGRCCTGAARCLLHRLGHQVHGILPSLLDLGNHILYRAGGVDRTGVDLRIGAGFWVVDRQNQVPVGVNLRTGHTRTLRALGPHQRCKPFLFGALIPGCHRDGIGRVRADFYCLSHKLLPALLSRYLVKQNPPGRFRFG